MFLCDGTHIVQDCLVVLVRCWSCCFGLLLVLLFCVGRMVVCRWNLIHHDFKREFRNYDSDRLSDEQI